MYLDSHWGIGASVRELVQGVDCPMTAAYMDAVTFFKGASKPNFHKSAICVFEHNPGGLVTGDHRDGCTNTRQAVVWGGASSLCACCQSLLGNLAGPL